jgi:hypothetical protein
MRYNDLGPKHALWQRLRRCLLHDKTRAALTTALAKHTDHLQQRAAVLAVLRAYEKRPLARSRSTISRMLNGIMAYLERLVAPDLPWELKRTEKGLGVYAKTSFTLTLAAIQAQLGRAEVIVLTEEQRARESANPDQHCLVKLGKKLGVVIGPVALFNKPCSGGTPHLLLCNLPTVSALERSKKCIRRALQECVVEQQQQQHVADEQQQQQQGRTTRGCGEKPLSPKAVAAAEAQSSADLRVAAGKRKFCVSNSTLMSEDRLLPEVSVRLHSSHRSERVHLSAEEELLLGYGTAYGTFDG